jgi:YegS/Rv2252/BmrU family lipid kinase
MKGAALVVNPVKVDDVEALTRALAERCAVAGWPEPLVIETTEDDPGTAMARQGVEAGVDVVVVAGGDGTVRAVADGLAGTGVAMAVVPQGTGNLLARNLDLAMNVEDALDAAVDGVDRTFDIGRLDDGTAFTVMAGAGFDAATMREAPEGLKSAVGWPAYIVGGIRSLRRSHVRVELRVDDDPPVRARVRTVLIGNLGMLQGGVDLMPDARPDDGLLDVALVAPNGLFDWLVLLVNGLRGRPSPGRRLQTWQGRRIDVRLRRPQPRQVDGDLIADGVRLRAAIEPGALVVRMPRTEDSPLEPSSGAAAEEEQS